MKKGFTLIELLVVVALIAILVSIGAASYTSAQKKARDSKRRGDLHALQQAMEQYYGDYGGYPLPAFAFAGSCSPGAVYLPGGEPKDPKTGLAYTAITLFGASCSKTTYCLCATLEGETNAVKGCDGSAPDPTVGTGALCVRNLQ